MGFIEDPRCGSGPAAILFALRDACSNSITKLFCACFMGYHTIVARYVATWDLAQMCLYETQCQGGVSHHLGWVLTSLKNLPRYGVPGGPRDWTKINLEGRYWKNQAFNTEWNFQSRMKCSFQAPLWPQKNRAWDWNLQSRMKFSNREWKFQARVKTFVSQFCALVRSRSWREHLVLAVEWKLLCVGEWFFSCVRARMNFFDPRSGYRSDSVAVSRTKAPSAAWRGLLLHLPAP